MRVFLLFFFSGGRAPELDLPVKSRTRSTYVNDPDSSPRREGKQVPRTLTNTLLCTAWSWLGGRNRLKSKKKTLFDLLSRLHEPLRGAVAIDGRDVAE